MEAVPRLHMLWFALKSSPEGTSFANLKKYIAEFYHEDPESFSKEVFALETLRNQAMHPGKDGSNILKRYYSQLHSLQNRFPHLLERGMFTFTWKDLYHSGVHEINDLRYEQAAVLFNIAASHTQHGASVTRGDVDGMKVACTHFQCAAWAFGELRERYGKYISGDFMTTELLLFMQQVSFAQAQECILEKSLIDNRKPNIVAKVTAQIIVYYGAALAALLTGGDDGPISQVVDSSLYKLWKKYVRFKISYLNCILYLYQGQHAEEQRKMGERVTLYQAAWEKLEEARKESKGLPDQKEINESLIFTADVVEAKRKNAKNENEFIYHEAVPELSTISAVQGANLVNGVAFSVTDPEVSGEDIFARLVPMKAHEASSLYSEEKAKILRKYGAKIEERDNELNSYMSSLSLDNLNISEEKANKVPQGIVDRCASLNANQNAIPDLISSMSQLAEICADVEVNLKEISDMLKEEEKEEKEFQTSTGVKRTPNAHITELTREYQKYAEAHSRAGESNETLRRAMELHVNNLKILSKPLQDIQQSIPKLSSELNTAEIFKDVKLILNKVNEMKAQRAQFHADLRIAVNDDDITAKVIAHSAENGLQNLFEKELSKHDRLTQLIDQNLLAQKNILHALTESYAKAAPVLKTLTDVKNKRETFFGSLAASYDVYEDLLSKSAKGLEFYKKLSSNVNKLMTRLKSARAVQSEERQQRLKSVINNPIANPAPAIPFSYAPTVPSVPTNNSTPKLRDYLKPKNSSASALQNAVIMDPSSSTLSAVQNPYIPSVRPNPLGSENPSQAACSTYYQPSPAPNEPPPPYSLQQQQYYDSSMPGYTNPMFQQHQQHIAPPAYKPQASPNSSFSTLNNQMAQLSLQHQSSQHLSQPQQQQAQLNYYSQQQQQQQQQQNQLQAPQQNYPSAYNQANVNFSMQSNTYPISNVSSASAPSANQFGNVYQNSNSQQILPNPTYDARLLAGGYGQQGLLITAPNSSKISSNIAPQPPNFQQPNNYNPPPQSSGISTAIVPATQPLYVMTNANNTNTIAASLQAPYVVNPLQAQQANTNQLIPSGMQQTVQNNENLALLNGVQPSPGLSDQHQLSQQVSSNASTIRHNQVKAVLPPSEQQQQIFCVSSNSISAGNIQDQNFTPYASSVKHPGYSFNPQTGQYEYGSGYQQASSLNGKFYGQYTSAAQHASLTGTDSDLANKINVATGFDAPIVSHTKNVTRSTGNSIEKTDCRYYTPPYGYQSNGMASAIPPIQQAQLQQLQQPLQSPKLTSYEQKSIYIQSGSSSIASTQTTGSGTQYASSAHQTPSGTPAANTPVGTALNNIPPQNSGDNTAAETVPTPTQAPATEPTPPPAQVAAPPPAKAPTQPPMQASAQPMEKPTPNPQALPKKSSNIDLLSDIDFSGNVPLPILPEPILKPFVVSTPPPGQIDSKEPNPPLSPAIGETKPSSPISDTPQANPPLQLSSPTISSDHRKPSIDNLSACSDLSSLENFDWDSVSVRSDQQQIAKENHSVNLNTFQLKSQNPFSDEKILKYFHKEVEQYEKIIENLNVKMLNGHTHLTAKWKELQDLLNKDSTKRITTIAKLFPEKNRSLDCLPYDHARVKLDRETDDYINAAYIKNLGTGCPNVIVAQTPQQNTINDFWSMVWSEKARTILCLHTSNEMLDPYWPQEIDHESHFDDYSLNCTEIKQLSHCTKYHLKLTMTGADPVIDLVILQIKSWNKSSLSHILGIAANALEAHQQICSGPKSVNSALITNCLTGSERSELLVVALCSVVATQIKRPVLINVVDVWYRICSQRQNSLRGTSILEQSMLIVLNHAHDVLNKRGIMTSYQMKIAPQVASKEKDEIKDPLNELDPLWKLK